MPQTYIKWFMIRENIRPLKVLNERWILKESGGTKDVYLDRYN